MKMNGQDIRRELRRPNDTACMLALCAECDQDIVMGFEGDYLCFWCRYTADTGKAAFKPDSSTFSAFDDKDYDENYEIYKYEPTSHEYILPRKRDDWRPADFGHEYDWSDFDL